MFDNTVTRGTGAWRHGKLTTTYIYILLFLCCPILAEGIDRDLSSLFPLIYAILPKYHVPAPLIFGRLDRRNAHCCTNWTAGRASSGVYCTLSTLR